MLAFSQFDKNITPRKMTKGVQHMLAILPAIILLSLLPAGTFQSSTGYRLSDRCRKCGSVSVPYPFGINDPDCTLNWEFVLNCPSNELFRRKNMPASDISLENGTVIIQIDTAHQCINSGGQTDDFSQNISLGSGLFRFSIRVVMEWEAGSGTCNKEQKRQNHACGKNSRCKCSENGQGYRCLCKDVFGGNPYLNCTDNNECKRNPRKGTCKNTVVSYKCRCPPGTHMDAKPGRFRGFRITTICTVSVGTTLGLIIVFLVVTAFKKRRKQKNFLNNGGTLLKHQRVGIFTEAELAKATNNYHSAHFLGEGAFGSVYKGTLANDIQVAVKKPKEWGKNTINNEFQSEIGVVSQVNHKNVVKLLGLCLETRVPLLVYEHVSNGTLYEHIHQKKSQILLTWKNRLRIAAEVALALDYFHSLANPPIIHGDVKSANILLDDKFTAKVSDFGASVLISSGKTNIAEVVRGTLGYLDPQYLMTGNLTAKSDVYSFGVVLVELLTGKKPNSAWVGEDCNIIEYFLTALENNRLFQILWFDLVQDDDGEEMEEIKSMAELAKKCVNPSSSGRPSMKLVADELSRLRKSNETPWPEQNFEETEGSIDEIEYLSCHIDMPDTLELRILAMDQRVRRSV